MADKWPDLLRARSWQDLPPRIYVALVGQLFGTPAFINLLEVLLIATIGGMASLRSGDPWLAGLNLAPCAAVLTVIPPRRHFEAPPTLAGSAPRVRRFHRVFDLPPR